MPSISTQYLASFLAGQCRDSRPRIRADFLGNDQRVSHSLLFDTGSDRSYMLLGFEAYKDEGQGAVVANGGQLAYGTESCLRRFPVVRKQREMIRLYSRRTREEYIYLVEVDLVQNLPPGDPDVGLLGAGQSSQFARDVGVFSYVPHAEDAGTIALGDPEPICSSGLPVRYFPTVAQLPDHWVVSGRVAVIDGRGLDVDWMVDTGATGYFMMPANYEDLTGQLVSMGSNVVNRGGLNYPEVMNCRDYETRFPSFYYVIGGLMGIRIRPVDYVFGFNERTNRCYLNIFTDGFEGYPRLKLLTMDTLRKLSRTVFDARNSRMGFCLQPLVGAEAQTTTTTTTARPSIISTEYLRSFIDRQDRDNRPRIIVDFLGNDQRVSHSVLFDTGSDRSYMRIGHEAYRDEGQGAVVALGGQLAYGTDDLQEVFAVVRKQTEMIRLYSRRTGDEYSHLIEIDLVAQIPPAYPDIGLFGASPSSDFAKAVGIFSYEPHPDDAGTIVIGEPSPLCPSGQPMVYYPNAPGHVVHWVVPGRVGVGDSRSQAVDWLVDTGASGYYMHADMFDFLKQELRALGSGVVERPGFYTTIYNCIEYQTRFPPIQYVIGAGVRLRITPADYISDYDAATGTCYANIFTGGVGRNPGLKLLTIDILRKLHRTVFDARNSRIGFCNQ